MMTFIKAIGNSIKHWYVSLITGILLIALGIYIFTIPLEAYLTLAILFSVSFILSGILEIYFSIRNRDEIDDWGWHLSGGILNLLAGIILVAYPSISMTTLPFMVGFTLLFRSFQGLGLAFDLKNYGVSNWGNVAAANVIGMIISLLLIGHPLFTGISLVVLTALSFISVGISAVILAFKLRRLKKLPGRISSELKSRISQLREEYKQQLSKNKTATN